MNLEADKIATMSEVSASSVVDINSEDILSSVKTFVRFHGYRGKKAIFWASAFTIKFLIFICQTIYLIQEHKNPDRMFAAAATYPVLFMTVCKLFALMFQESRCDNIHKQMEEDFWDISVGNKSLQEKIRRRFKFIKMLTWSHFTSSSLFVILFIFFPFVETPEGKKRLPVLLWTPFDTNPSPIYELTFLILSLNFYLSILGNVMFDFLFLYAAQHLSIQFMLLEDLLQNFTHELMTTYDDIDKFHSEKFQKIVHNRMSICAKQHCILLKFGSEIEKLSSIVMGLQFLASYAALVFGGYTLSLHSSDLMKTSLLLILTSSVTIQLTIFALHGTDLQERSTAVADAIYQSQWYLFNVSTRRSIRYMLMNSFKGVKLTTAGLAEVNNEILVGVYQKAFSTITLLQSL